MGTPSSPFTLVWDGALRGESSWATANDVLQQPRYSGWRISNKNRWEEVAGPRSWHVGHFFANGLMFERRCVLAGSPRGARPLAWAEDGSIAVAAGDDVFVVTCTLGPRVTHRSPMSPRFLQPVTSKALMGPHRGTGPTRTAIEVSQPSSLNSRSRTPFLGVVVVVFVSIQRLDALIYASSLVDFLKGDFVGPRQGGSSAVAAPGYPQHGSC